MSGGRTGPAWKREWNMDKGREREEERECSWQQ